MQDPKLRAPFTLIAINQPSHNRSAPSHTRASSVADEFTFGSVQRYLFLLNAQIAHSKMTRVRPAYLFQAARVALRKDCSATTEGCSLRIGKEERDLYRGRVFQSHVDMAPWLGKAVQAWASITIS